MRFSPGATALSAIACLAESAWQNRPLASLVLALALSLLPPAVAAQDKVTIGFITDMSGLYADKEGKNGALANQMAIDDFGGKVDGMLVELLTADHQNKADIAASNGQGVIRADGRFVHDLYLLQVKSPAESKAPWDYFRVISRLKGEDVATTKAESKCVLWH
jgi:ABC-type branched-subunit amino acid transport system substrate-binding protein